MIAGAIDINATAPTPVCRRGRSPNTSSWHAPPRASASSPATFRSRTSPIRRTWFRVWSRRRSAGSGEGGAL